MNFKLWQKKICIFTILSFSICSLSGCFVVDNVKKVKNTISDTANNIFDKKDTVPKTTEKDVIKDDKVTDIPDIKTKSSEKEKAVFDISKYTDKVWATDNPEHHTYVMEILDDEFNKNAETIGFYIRYFEEGDVKHTAEIMHEAKIEDLRKMKNNEYSFSFDSDGYSHSGNARIIFNDNSIDLCFDNVYGSNNTWGVTVGKHHLENNENIYNELPTADKYEELYQNTYFLFPSDTSYITEYDIAGLSQLDVALIRNEIYARHGYIFSNEPYKSYFESMDWYIPNPNFNDSMLNVVEKANRDFLIEYEKQNGWR